MDQQQTPASPPQWNPPPDAPPPQQWQTPPQQPPAAWGQGSYAAPPPRPGAVTFAGIFLIILGVLALLGAALVFMGGAIVGGVADLGNAAGVFAGIFAFLAILLLVWGLANLIGGIGVLQGKGWGRVTGIVVAIIAVVFGVLGLLGSLGQGVEPSGLLMNLVILAGYAVVAWALFKSAPYFAYRR